LPEIVGILIDKSIEPEYGISVKETSINEIKELANSASAIYLATDLTRRRTISWHLIKQPIEKINKRSGEYFSRNHQTRPVEDDLTIPRS